MASAAWSAAADLMKLAGEETLEAACTKLGILELGEAKDVVLEEEPNWRRAGSETYQLRCGVFASGGRRREILFKACVAFEPDSTAGAVAAKWISRRLQLSTLGVKAPSLFGMVDATIVEEWIELSLVEAFAGASAPDRLHLCRGLGEYAGALSALRYWPVDAFADLRSTGTDVIAVDFGEDLGPPSMAGAPPGLAMAFDAIAALERSGIRLESPEIAEVLAGFDSVDEAPPTSDRV